MVKGLFTAPQKKKNFLTKTIDKTAVVWYYNRAVAE
jgi:hypothetical protein